MVNDIRIGKYIEDLVTGNVYQLDYKGSRIEGTLEGLEGENLVLRACTKKQGTRRSLVDRIEIPYHCFRLFNPL